MGSRYKEGPSKEQLKDLYWGQGFSFEMVANKLGYSKSGIRDMFRRLGIPRHTLSEALQIAARAGRRRYNGGRVISTHGYILILNREHPRANSRGYVMEHILVLEKKLGRALLANEVGHHLNGIKGDNRPENLIAIVRKEHSSTLVMQALHERVKDLERRLLVYESHKC